MARRPPLVAGGAAATILTGCARLGAPRGATAEAREVRELWDAFFLAAVAVAAVVYALIVWSLVRYRRRSEELPAQVRANVPLEVAYTAAPIVVVAALFALTTPVERDVGDLSREPAVTIDVEAFNWSWRFAYRGRGVSVVGTPERPPELVVPVGERVRIVLTSPDVIHSWYVPEFAFKRDAIPGEATRFEFEVAQVGVFRGRCAEFCGLDHARMLFSVRAIPSHAFRAWLSEARTAVAA